MKLAAFERAVTACKSYTIALQLLDGELAIEDAVVAAQLETVYQCQRWGEVDDAHDVAKEDLRRTLASCLLHDV